MDPVAFRNLVDEVKERTDVVELIGRDIELRSSGSHFVGHSPWNRDTTPSLLVWPDSQRWMDYSGGGNGGGDCISYLQRREGIDFMEALRQLAVRAGVAMPNGSSGDAVEAARAMIERRRIEDLHAIAATYYHGGLPAKIRREWLQDRYGFTDETIDRLLLGWADGHLFDHLTETAGANTEEALSTGLFVRTRGGRVVDLFCTRIVFPYWRRGRVCYFIARQTEHTDDKPWEQAKYKKLLTRSNKHPYVSKHVQNDTFYGEDSIRGAEEIVVTEGVTDAIAVLQCGLAVLSPVTVRFRKRDHGKLIALTKRARRVVICNDNEENGAGEAGAVETAKALFESSRDVRIAVIPRPKGTEKIDVNELVANGGVETLRQVIDGARRYPEYLLDKVPADTQKQDLDRTLEPVMQAVALLEPIERDVYKDLIAERFKLRLRPLNARLKEVARRQRVERAEAKFERSGLPHIMLGSRQLRDVLADAGAVLTEANTRLVAEASQRPIPSSDAAPLFIRGGRLVRIDTSKGSPAVAELDDVEVYGLLARVADWFVNMEEGPVATNPSRAVSSDMLVYPPAGLPKLLDVVATPVFGADGQLIAEPGYHEAEKLWLHRDPDLALTPIVDQPSEDDVVRARTLLLEELMGDFRFVGEADRAHALAALLLPFARRLIDGYTPLHLVEAPTPGTGKGLLCNLISIVATGRPCESRTVPTAEDEIRKMVTAELTKARPIVLLDNLPERRSLDSSALAAVVTCDPWTDRVLGESRMISLPNRAMWMVTANNPSLSDELARRCIRIRLDSREEMPWRRKNFRHPKIRRWATDHRSELVHAALVLIRAWIAEGMPLSDKQLGSFEEWVGVIGGVLEVAGVPCFLDNLDELYQRTNAERAAWSELAMAWIAAFSSEAKRVSEINELCEQRELMTSQRGDGNERSQQSRLGRLLAAARDRVYCGLRLTLVEDQGRHKGRMYALVRVSGEDTPSHETDFGTEGTSHDSGDMEGTWPPTSPPAEQYEYQGEIDPWGT